MEIEFTIKDLEVEVFSGIENLSFIREKIDSYATNDIGVYDYSISQRTGTCNSYYTVVFRIIKPKYRVVIKDVYSGIILDYFDKVYTSVFDAEHFCNEYNEDLTDQKLNGIKARPERISYLDNKI